MTTRRAILVLAGGLLILGMAASAGAAEGPKTPWGLGGQVGYLWVPGFVLDGFYEKHEDIAALYYGVYGSYSFKPFDLRFGVNHSQIDFGEGEFLKRGEPKDETDYVEADLGMFDAEVTVLWRWDLHRYVRWHLGGGLGMGFLYGTYESRDVLFETNEQGEEVKTLAEEKATPHLPPIIPVVIAQTGLSIMPVPKVFSIHLGFGVRNGVTVCGGLQGYF